MIDRLLNNRYAAGILGVGMPVQSLVVDAVTDWRGIVKDCNLVFAVITAAVIAVSSILKLYRDLRFRERTVAAAEARVGQRRQGCGRPGCYGGDWLPPLGFGSEDAPKSK